MKARNLALFALFVGPAAAAVDLLVSYYLVYRAQGDGSKIWLHVVTLVSAAAAVVGIVLARRVLARRGETAEVDRFLALAGVALNAFFLLVVVGFAVPTLVHGVHD